MVSPSARRQGVRELIAEWGCSERHACVMVAISRSSARLKPRTRVGDRELTARVRELAFRHHRYGYRMVTAILRREGSPVNRKRVHRIWKAEGLQVPRRSRRKRRRGPQGEVIHKAERINHVWTYDFMEDRTEKGGQLRVLTILDEYTRESLAIRVERTIAAAKVLDSLDWLFLTRGVPEHLRSDNGPEFIAKAVQEWLAHRGSKTIYIAPGSPWENPFIESFNGTLRAECLNQYVFANDQEAQEIIEAWRNEYNQYRPHSSLGYQTPAEFAAQAAKSLRPTACAPLPPETKELILSL